MSQYWRKRKERKQRIVETVKQDQAKIQARRLELEGLSSEDRKIARDADKALRKTQKQSYKKELRTMSRQDRRQQKKEDKIYRKVSHRKGRAMGWMIFGVVVALLVVNFGPMVSDILGVMSGKVITMDSSTPEGIKAREAAEKVSQRLVDEGIVLLKNDDDHLPYKDTDKINIFGVSSHMIRHGGGGSGATDVSRAVDFFTALNQAGIEYNETLTASYEKLAKGNKGGGVGLTQVIAGFLGKSGSDEPAIDHLTDEMLAQAKAYSDSAVIVITSSGTEASDFTPEQLRLSDNKRALIDKVTGEFENVTIIINAGNALELGFIEEYPQIKSVVWMGTPGPFGAESLASVLSGKVNPSGRLTDTYAYDVTSSPASVNFGNYKYKNLNKAFIEYQEGIYVGYRYYETRYGHDESAYQKIVQYPFGYGLSYSEFEWDVISTDFNADTMSVKVSVTNTGEVAGKDVIQLYYGAPYIEGGLEKSSIELASYAKTELLEPQETQVLELSFKTRDMASYDMNESQNYILDAGTYEISIARNVHSKDFTFDYTIEDKVVYTKNDQTDVAYVNRFDDVAGDVVYLSRADWEGTFPDDSGFDYLASQSLLDDFGKINIPSSLEMPELGADHGIQLSDLKGLDKHDTQWTLFLDQLTKEELIQFVSRAAYKTNGTDRLGIPQTLLMDGPAGFSFFFGNYVAAGYPSEIIVAATWNDALVYEFGEAVGKEAVAYGIDGWYAPAMNLHRTAQGGRNFEYFSEDPVLSGKISASITRGAQDQGVVVFMKHFVMNDQETNARSGIVVWSNEQAMRELYLKPFEITVKEADVMGVMSSFSYLGPHWAGANDRLLNGILRDEWGFDGMISSDAVFGFMHGDDAILAGNDVFLDIFSASKNIKRIKKTYKQHPEAMTHALRRGVHNSLYTLLQTHTFNK